MRLGIFSGTFNPIHLGHLILAEEACYQLELDRVLWILTPVPPHKPKQPILEWEDRLQMLFLAVANNPIFEISYVDIRRQPPHYARDTMLLLREIYPEDQLFFLMGSDSLRDMPDWYCPLELVHACDGLIVMMRPHITIDYEWLDGKIPGVLNKINRLSTPHIEIASSDIRRRIANCEAYRYYLHPGVYEYIQKHKLYLS